MASENLAGRTIAGYRLLERVGEGGTAAVYRARHADRGLAAVKVLKDRFRNDAVTVKRFLREAGYGTRVQHPAVVRTYDFGQLEDLYYLALEWAEGEALSACISRDGPLDPRLVAQIIDQLASALTAAHAVGIIHRDLKPENIMFDRATEGVKLLDFGIARDAQEASGDRLTRAGFFVGTLQYVAPEALSGALAGEPADIYSLATITYYLLTGRHPFHGKSPRDLFTQLLNSDPRPLRDAAGPDLIVTPGLELAVMTALSRDPEKRQKSVREFADQVIAGIREKPAEPPPTWPIDRILKTLGFK
ncbi:MAG: serine/threonine protein kinase [Gemmatimonadetes bacterium]|nr:serine/threonine protein kinase [Gemmatimonadota bacterium]